VNVFQIALTQKGLARKAVAQPCVTMARLAQAHTVWGFLLALPHQDSNISSGCLPEACHSTDLKVETSPYSHYIGGAVALKEG